MMRNEIFPLMDIPQLGMGGGGGGVEIRQNDNDHSSILHRCNVKHVDPNGIRYGLKISRNGKNPSVW